jgi:hypothetical protein
MRRWLLALLLVVALVVTIVVVAAVTEDDDDWDPDAQFAPSLRPAFGARADGDALVFTTGAPCPAVRAMRVTFDPASDDRVVLDLAADAPVDLTTFDPTGGDAVLRPTDPVPEGFDWREHETATFVLTDPQVGYGSTVDLGAVVEGSPEHAADTFWFQDVGWLDPAQLAAEDGESFLSTCSPDPGE